MILIK